MDSNLFWPMAVAASIFFLTSAACYLWSQAPNILEWKGSSRVFAVLCLSVGLFLAGVAKHQYDLQLPLTEATGRVDSIVMNRHSADIVLRLTSAEVLKLRAPDDHNFFGKSCEPSDSCYVTSTPLFIRQEQQLRVQYLTSPGVQELVSAECLSKDGKYVEIYRNRRTLGNIWTFAAMITLLFGLARSKPTQWRPQSKVGDNVAERFTPEDQPGAHWKFVETENGIRFATEQENFRKNSSATDLEVYPRRSTRVIQLLPAAVAADAPATQE